MTAKYPKPLKVRDGEYVPDLGIDYPVDDPMTRLLPFVDVKGYVFDENFPYLDKSLKFRIYRHTLTNFISYVMLWFVNKFKYGMRYRGREIVRRHRREFRRRGVVTVCNHCYKYDGIAIAQLLRHNIWTPMLKDHINGESSFMLRIFGGIPVPEESAAALRKFNEAFDELHERREWINVFAEGRSWPFYKPLKPFKKGAFTMAYKYDAPVLPLCITFRPRTGIYRLFAPANVPLLTITAGEPIMPDRSARRSEEVDRLLRTTHAKICEMAGIVENPWPAFID